MGECKLIFFLLCDALQGIEILVVLYYSKVSVSQEGGGSTNNTDAKTKDSGNNLLSSIGFQVINVIHLKKYIQLD